MRLMNIGVRQVKLELRESAKLVFKIGKPLSQMGKTARAPREQPKRKSQRERRVCIKIR